MSGLESQWAGPDPQFQALLEPYSKTGLVPTPEEWDRIVNQYKAAELGRNAVEHAQVADAVVIQAADRFTAQGDRDVA